MPKLKPAVVLYWYQPRACWIKEIKELNHVEVRQKSHLETTTEGGATCSYSRVTIHKFFWQTMLQSLYAEIQTSVTEEWKMWTSSQAIWDLLGARVSIRKCGWRKFSYILLSFCILNHIGTIYVYFLGIFTGQSCYVGDFPESWLLIKRKNHLS